MTDRFGLEGDPQVVAFKVALDTQSQVQILGGVGVPAADFHQEAATERTKGA
ncbi:hypothetical protein D3C87_2110700 [compost metagenome]